MAFALPDPPMAKQLGCLCIGMLPCPEPTGQTGIQLGGADAQKGAHVHFQRFTVEDHEHLLRQIEQTRLELAAAQARGDHGATLELAAELGEGLTTARREGEARALLVGYLPLARQHGDPEATGWLLLVLATANQYLERRSEANGQFAQALRLARSCGSQRLEHFILHHWGRALVEAGEHERALACFTRALELRVALDEPLQASTRRAIAALAELTRAGYSEERNT